MALPGVVQSLKCQSMVYRPVSTEPIPLIAHYSKNMMPCLVYFKTIAACLKVLLMKEEKVQ